MRYLGGKSRIGKKIAAIVNAEIAANPRPYLEPFCGACWVTQHIVAPSRMCSDANGALIAMWQALQAGWVPPTEVSEAMYADAKAGKLDPATTAFIGFGCSFGGKWFGGYARDYRGADYCRAAKNSLAAKLKNLAGVEFVNLPYEALAPEGRVIYCDPPYQGTTSYRAVPAFDTGKFWDTVRRWAESNTVFVSEYAAPDDIPCVAEFQTRLGMRSKSGREPRIEKLFSLGTAHHAI